MINIKSIKAVVYDHDENTFGFNYDFNSGLNILTGENSSGKSTVLSCIYYCLGLEQLSFGSADGLKDCLRNGFTHHGVDYTVYSSYTELYLSNLNGDIASIKRTIKGSFSEDLNILTVTMKDGAPEDKFLHGKGDTTHEDGFYKWLSEFSGINVPVFTDAAGKTNTILYLQQIFSSSFVEQTKGWSDFFAQVPVFSTKKAKQKIVEYILGLSNLLEEFELDKLKEHEKEQKSLWGNVIEGFKTVSSYYNFQPANLPNGFSAEMSPEKISKLTLVTRESENHFSAIEVVTAKLKKDIEKLEAKNEIKSERNLNSGHLTARQGQLTVQLQHLNDELKKIVKSGVNERIKKEKYKQIFQQLSNEIEALEGIDKLNGLVDFKIGAVESCPVCQSSLLQYPDIKLQNVEQINAVKSLPFYKSERALYESYLQNSDNLLAQLHKAINYYEERIAETKGFLDIIDRQLIEDSRIPSRLDISEEVRLRFELEKLTKVQKLFSQFKLDLIGIARSMAILRARKKELKANKDTDLTKVRTFQRKFIDNLKSFGYSSGSTDKIYILTNDEPNKWFPVVKSVNLDMAQPIRLLSSASDFIRTQWAYYLALLTQSKHHLGLLVLDEPGQHAMKSKDLSALFKVCSAIKNRQIIIAISKEEELRLSSDEVGTERQVNVLNILRNSNLMENEDYNINYIDDHQIGDKCIQPLVLIDENTEINKPKEHEDLSNEEDADSEEDELPF